VSVHVLAFVVDLRLPAAHSLKEKRAVLKTILEGARRRYQVAAAETDEQDNWNRAELGFSVVSPSVAHAQEVIDAVERFVWSFPEIEVLGTERLWLDTTDR
jgi:uncharacterized protein YlxP (DUF503 family)